MTNEEVYIKYLKEVKRKLKASEMSVMVGAGFSKNVDNDLFPSWWQLLRDMVLFRNEKKFVDEYLQIRPASKRPNKDKFINDKVDQYFNEIGFLKVASRYMEQHGYRESVDTYIEYRTPYIVNYEGNKYLRYFENEQPKDLFLTDEHLSSHRKLVNLPWNNIYTTNYDNLLEGCVDEDVEGEILKQIKSIRSALAEMVTQQIENEKKVEELKEELIKLKDKNRPSKISFERPGIAFEAEFATDELESDSENEVEIKKLDILKKEISDIEWKIQFTARQILLKEDELSKLELLRKECPSVVVRSSQLALKKTRNIIKLHGSRRTENNSIFGFDDDARKQYVITQEDFDTYPVKHEAFTQLMRISLLQESFCLIGFSGVDPNFLAWIGWVRDVLFKDKEGSDKDPLKKIYMISVSKLPVVGTINYGRTTFYENQRIADIPLMEDKCIDFMEEATGLKVKSRQSKKDVLNLFFDYLQSDIPLTGPELAIEVSYRSKFNQILDNQPNIERGKISKEEVEGLLQHFSDLPELVKYNRFPSLIFSYEFSRRKFLDRIDLYLNVIQEDREQLQIYLNAVSIFMKVQSYPIFLLHDKRETFNKILNYSKEISDQLYAEFLLLFLKEAIWEGNEKEVNKIEKKLRNYSDENVDQERQYLLALYNLLRCRFDVLEKRLSAWIARGHWVVKKASLLSNLEPDKARELLLNNDIRVVQEHLYELELEKYLDTSIYYGGTKSIEQYRYLKDSGLHTIANSADYLLREINKDAIKILPYGDNRYTINNSMTLSNTSKELQSLQYVGLMLDSGYPYAISFRNFREPSVIYSVFKNVLPYRCFPIIQSVLQFSDYKFVRRVAQDFILTNHGIEIFERICADLQRAYFNRRTPNRYKEGILAFLSELINVIEPSKWSSFFRKVWNSELSDMHKRHNTKNGWSTYLNKGLNLIQSPSLISKIVNDCLTTYIKDHGAENLIQYLYELASNPYLKLHATAITSENNEVVIELIKTIKVQPASIFLCGNLEVLLAAEHKEMIYEELKSFDFQKVESSAFWRVAVYFTKDDLEILEKIKSAILKNKSLWDAGFLKESGFSYTRRDFISLHYLRKIDEFPGLRWNEEEVLSLYEVLIPVFERIKGAIEKKIDLEFFNNVLEEMVLFLQDESEILETVEGFNTLQYEAIKLHTGQRKFDDPLQGLISTDQSKVLRALNGLLTNMYEFQDLSTYKIYTDVIVNKVLLQSQPRLEACIDALSNLLYYHKDKDKLQWYKDILVAILIKYKEVPLENGDQPFIEEKLVRIAFVLDNWGMKDEIIMHFLSLLKLSRFNNVKFNLATELKMC